MSKRSTQLVLTAATALAIGVGIGAFLFGGLADVMASAGSAAPALRAPQVSAPDAQRKTQVEPVDVRGSASFAARAAVRGRAPELPAAPAASLDEADAGPRLVQGSILTLDGRPLGGVELELEPPKGAPKYQLRLTTSDADGHFEFTGLPEGVWGLVGRHPDYVLQRRTSFPTRVPTGSQVDFIACPGVSIEVSVVGPGAERARVAFRRRRSGSPKWSKWSPANSKLALRPGAWELCASVDAMEDWPSNRGWKLAPIASEVLTVHVGVEESQQVTLELGKVNCLYGIVHLPEGHQGGDTRPRVRFIETENGTAADFDSAGDRTELGDSVDEQGRYGLFALRYERWTAGATLRWGKPPTVQVVEIDGLTRVDFDQFGVEGEGSVFVDAFSPAGHRITESLSFSLGHRDADDEPDDYLWQMTRTVLETGGSLRVLALPVDADEREEYEKKEQLFLRASMSGFGQIDQPLSGLNGERFRLDFVSSAELEVVLVGEGAMRAMRKCNGRLDGDQTDSRAEFSEADEALKFTSLLPGSYQLKLTSWRRSDGNWRQELLHEGELEIRAGLQRIEVPMPIRGDLLVRCPGVKLDASASLMGPLNENTSEDRSKDRNGTWASAEVDEHGQVLFADMLAGTYRLTIGPHMQIVRVPSPPIDFEGRLPDRYRFRLQEGDSPLRRAGVRSGDLFVAIDGEELSFDDAARRLKALSTQSEGSIQLTVDRFGQSLNFTLKASDLGENESYSRNELEPVLE